MAVPRQVLVHVGSFFCIHVWSGFHCSGIINMSRNGIESSDYVSSAVNVMALFMLLMC